MPETINNTIYEDLADTWWQEAGFLQSLKALNPGRFIYLDKLLSEQGIDPTQLAVIDIGCGGGYASEHMAKMGMQVTGVDPSEASIRAAREHALATGLEIDYRLGAGESLPMEDNSCDIAFCCDVLEHVDDVQQVLKEIHRVVKPGGVFFFDTINRTAFSWLVMIKLAQDIPLTRFMPRNTHVWHMFIKPKELNDFLLKAGFSPRDITGFAPGFSAKALLRAAVSRLKGEPPGALRREITMGPSSMKAGLYMGWAQK